MAADPYSILGLARTASDAEIKSAYRKLAKQLHPDTNKDNPKAAERFAEVSRAYDLLSDKEKRARFDRGEIDADGNPAAPFGGGGPFGGGQGFRHEAGFETGGIDLGEMFEGLFGGRGGGFGTQTGARRPAARGANVNYRLAVAFADAALGKPQRLVLAGGKAIDLKLPAGVESGQQMRLAGKGEPGPGGAGDALVTIDIQPHAFFTRSGDDIRLDLPITIDEALAGAQVKVPTVEGAVLLKVAAGSTSGRTLRLKGKGFVRKDGTRGDQLVTLMVDVPADDADLATRLAGWSDARAPRARLGV